jgi:GT2 family glycosyltransferase
MADLNTPPLVSIVMINWNRKKILKEVLTRLSRQTYEPFEIVCCDNNSTDGAPDMVAKSFPEVKLIRLNDNLGIAGYNMAFAQSAGEIIVILDNDSYLEDDSIAKIVEKFSTYPNLGALGCKVYNHYSGELHHWHPNFRKEHGATEGVDTPLFNGCAAAARRSVLKEVGFYPDEFFLYENERDLCTRIISAGYDVKYFTDITGYHMVHEEGRNSERLIYYGKRNLIWYYWKYMPLHVAVIKTLSISASSAVAAMTTGQAKIHLRPVFHGVVGLLKILKKRAPVEKSLIRKVLY